MPDCGEASCLLRVTLEHAHGEVPMRWIPVAGLVLALTSCGGDSWKDIGGLCATPRTGTDPATGRPLFPDRQGTLDDEKKFLRAWTDDTYLWYSEVPNFNPAQYPTAIDYFKVLRTPAITASGSPKDKFHFAMDTADWEALSQTGASAGYGVTWALLAPKPPRKVE